MRIESIQGEGQAEFHVAARQTDPALEVLQPGAVDPRIALRPIRETLFVDLWREKLGERRAHGFRPGCAAREVDIGVDRESNAGQHLRQTLRPLSRQSHRLRQPQPRFDPAGILAVAIVVEYALHPRAAHRTVRAIGQNGGILERDVDLVIEAIRHPGADLRRGRRTGIHHHIEGMMDVVGTAQTPQLHFEFLSAPGGGAHSTISMPSRATSTPRRESSTASGELSSRMGLVLLIWIKILRVADGRRCSHSSIPPGPLCGRCPMSRARLDETPSRISSSSAQNVPSTSTLAEHCMARHNRSSMALKPGAYTAVRPVTSSSMMSARLSPAMGESRLGE